MKKFLLFTALAFGWCAASAAAQLSRDQLVGEWLYTHWADKNNPRQENPVGVIMDFRDDGTVMIRSSGATGYQRARYQVEDGTIFYSDDNGEQEWKVESFEPGRSLVVSYENTLIFFEKVDS